MADRAPVASATASARKRRAALGHTVLAVAAAATTSAALVWAGLFYDAVRQQPAAQATTGAEGAPETGAPQQAPALAPVTTRTS